MGQSSLPFTDPWVVLGVHKGASKEEIKSAFRRAALACHPDVDPSPSAHARFAAVKAAADVLLKGHQGAPGRPHPGAAWNPAAAAAYRTAQASPGAPQNRVAALWAGLAVTCCLAFGYGAFLTSHASQRGYAADGAAPAGDPRLGGVLPQRQQLLRALLADKEAQRRRQGQQEGQARRRHEREGSATEAVGGGRG